MHPSKQNIQEKIFHGSIGSLCLLLSWGLYSNWSYGTLINILQTGIIIILSICLFFINMKKNAASKQEKGSNAAAAKTTAEPGQDKQLPSFAGPDNLFQNYSKLKTRLLELSDKDDDWSLVLERKRGDYSCKVEKRIGGDFFFRVSCDFESTPEEAFDYLSDVDGRNRWDELTEISGILEQVSHKSAVVYMRSKGIWPTAARDCLVMAFITRLEDGRYCNVTKSIDNHPNYQDRPGSVRMTANLAGLTVGKHPTNAKLCRCVQIIDGDLGGWLPPSIVSLVSTQAFPLSMGRVNSFLSKVGNPRTVSNLIEASEGKTMLAAKPAVETSTSPSAASKKSAVANAGNGGIFLRILNILKEYQPVLVLIVMLLVLRIRK